MHTSFRYGAKSYEVETTGRNQIKVVLLSNYLGSSCGFVKILIFSLEFFSLQDFYCGILNNHEKQ